MSFLLNAIYASLLMLGSPWLLWRYLRWGKNRRGWAQRLLGWAPIRESEQRCIWFHAVSVGEVNLLAPVLEAASTVAAGHRVGHFDNHRNRLRFGLSKIRRCQSVLLPVRFFMGDSQCYPTNPPEPDCVDRTRTLAQLDPDCRPARTNRTGRFRCVVRQIGRLSQYQDFRGYQRFRVVRGCKSNVLRGYESQPLASVRIWENQNESYAERFRALGIPPERVVVTGA